MAWYKFCWPREKNITPPLRGAWCVYSRVIHMRTTGYITLIKPGILFRRKQLLFSTQISSFFSTVNAKLLISYFYNELCTLTLIDVKVNLLGETRFNWLLMNYSQKIVYARPYLLCLKAVRFHGRWYWNGKLICI